MKKLFVLLLAVLMTFSLSACSLNGLMGFGNGEGVELNYDYEAMEQSLTQLKQEDGLLLEMTIVSTESGEQPESGKIIYAENADAFYYSGEDSEIMFDFSDETKCVTYEKQEDGTWTKYDTVYEESGITREQMEATAAVYTTSLTGYLSNYSQFAGQMMQVSSDTVAGRDCDKFTYSLMFMGFGMEYTFSIDKETGMCLKWEMSAAAGAEGSATVEYTCTRFETPYTITFPADAIDVTESNNDTEGNGDQSNNGGGNNDADNTEDGKPWPENSITALVPTPAQGKVVLSSVNESFAIIEVSWTYAEALAYVEQLKEAGFGDDIVQTFEQKKAVRRIHNGVEIYLIYLNDTTTSISLTLQ